ncbi:MAG: S8 family serine peptidase [Oscillospiraceae bacterium]|nr:S8 family serine peptidase [Oscillospiraceae bacterium]
MKKLCIMLAAIFLLSAFQPSRALECDTYTPTDDSSDGYIVKLKDTQADTVSLMENSDLTEISSKAGLYHADSVSDIKKLGSDVLYYEPDYKVTLAELPDDTYASRQWSIGYLGISSAWDAGYNGEGVKIAVIDSGVNTGHEDLAGANIADGYNVIDGTDNVRDDMGHGTFICGLISADRNNGRGIAGFCTDATIIPIKCFGESKETSSSYLIRSIYVAIDDYGCDVINLSSGMAENVRSLEDAVEYAAGKGVIVVASAGNDGNSMLNYPAAYDCVVGVGAVDQNGQVASFSEKNRSVFVVAPGVNLISLKTTQNNMYEIGAGTSYSAPFVSVAAAILKQYDLSATVDDFMEILKASSIDGGIKGYDTSYGYGSLNIANFLEVMQNYELRSIGEIFPDVQGHWASTSIDYCYRNGLFTGITQSSFEPETVMNRAMFVTVLSRMSKETISGYSNVFADVPEDSWYCQPCSWGAANGIVGGMGEGMFAPMGAVTREQMAVFLYRYAILYGLTDGSVNDPTAILFAFSDRDQVSDWAAEAMAWAIENGLITGRSETGLYPKDSAKRCEVATIITRFTALFADN